MGSVYVFLLNRKCNQYVTITHLMFILFSIYIYYLKKNMYLKIKRTPKMNNRTPKLIYVGLFE